MPRLSGRITVIAVGKLREPHWRSAQKTYQERLQHYTDLQLIEVKDVVGQGLPPKVAMKRESEQLLQAADTATRRFAMTPIGVQMSSPQLATFLQRQIQLYGDLAFLVGGPYGFSDDVLAQCHEQLSLSTLTFPHELARILLLEQLYRAATIINGEKYHK
jgi:23S rRNA (pseudouridine1915-N3)-methyltransferase